MDTFNNKVPSGPQDYVNFYHTNEEGNIYLDGEGKPFSLQRTLTEPGSGYNPLKTYWTQLRLDMGLMPLSAKGTQSQQ